MLAWTFRAVERGSRRATFAKREQAPESDGRRFSFGRSLSSPLFFFEGSVSSSIGALEFGLRRSVGLLGSSPVLSGRRWCSSIARRDFTSLNSGS